MRYIIKSSFYSLLLLVIALVSLLAFLLTTTPGLYLSFKIAKSFLPGTLNIEKLEGQLINQISFASLHYHYDKLDVELNDVQLQWPFKTLLRRQLTIDQLHIGTLIIDSRDPNSDWIKKAVLNLDKLPVRVAITHAKIDHVQFTKHYNTFLLENLTLQGSITKQAWEILSLNADYDNQHLILKAQGQSILPFSLSANLHLRPLDNTQPALEGNLDLGGDILLYHWHGELKKPNNLVLNGTLKEGSELHTFVQWNKTISPQKTSSMKSSLRIEGKLPEFTLNLNTTYFNHPMQAIFHYQNNAFTGHVTLGNNKLQLNGFSPFYWQASATLPEPALLHPSLAGLQTSITANASLTRAQHGKATITIHPGQFKLPDNGPLQVLQFNGGEIDVFLQPKHLQIKGNLAVDANKHLVLDFDLPKFQLLQGLSGKQPIAGSLILQVNSLSFLDSLSTELNKVQGQLQAILKVKGTLAKPIVEGHLSLDKASVSLPSLGITLNPVQFNLQSHDKHWEAQGKMVTNGNALTIAGKGELGPLSGLFTIQGNNFPLVKTTKYSAIISPQLTLEVATNKLALRGKIIASQAEIKIQALNNTVSLTEDVVIVSDKPPPSNPLPLETDINLEMGNNVVLDVKGLQGFVAGTIRLQQVPHGPLTASGELTIHDGKYKAYGQNLKVDQGLLLFTGGPVGNPSVQIRATREFTNASTSFAGTNQWFDFNAANIQTLDFGDKTTVGIMLTGQLNAPKIELFSIPANLSQADILSMLLLGRPANQADQAGGQLLLTALSSMNLDSGTRGMQLVEQLKQSLGVDFNLQTNTKYNLQTNQTTENNAVVVGKKLSKRLYLSYNLGLSQTDSNVLTLTYLLNKFFSIQVNASATASGIDLLYTHRKE